MVEFCFNRAAMLGALLVVGGCVTTPTRVDSESGSVTKPAPAKRTSGNATTSTPITREPGNVMSPSQWRWLESDKREAREDPDRIIKAMQLPADAKVADLGGGSGYYTRRLARAVPDGKVYLVEIDQKWLDRTMALAAKEGIRNIVPVLSTERSTKLEPGSVDRILIVDAYHEFQHREAMFQSIRRSLSPRGQVFVVEYRYNDTTRDYRTPEHTMSAAQIEEEWTQGGFELVLADTNHPAVSVVVFEVLSR